MGRRDKNNSTQSPGWQGVPAIPIIPAEFRLFRLKASVDVEFSCEKYWLEEFNRAVQRKN
jgi:hypothetical protein